MHSSPRIVIIGSGPCGLGAAWRLQELGHENFVVLERNAYPGGLATSFRDESGFLWDIGGHVTFSHYDYFDHVMNEVLPGGWRTHVRRTFVVESDGWTPYPFQNNLAHLPLRERASIVASFLSRPRTYGEDLLSWMRSVFGQELVERFMRPYNEKVWAHPLGTLSHTWVSERIATPSVTGMLAQLIGSTDSRWGANNTFRYPIRGGIGSVWDAVAKRLGSSIRYGEPVTSLDRRARTITTPNGSESYDVLISTMPADVLADLTNTPAPHLTRSSTNVIGFGFEGPKPDRLEGVSWMYFPEDDMPAYRATVFSNYSDDHTPDPDRYWSIMCEVSESEHRPVDHDQLAQRTLIALERLGLCDPERLVSTWRHRADYGYPTPTIERDRELEKIRALEEDDIYSRGRFGAWRYEVSNQDHTFMQGVEVIDRVLLDESERTMRR